MQLRRPGKMIRLFAVALVALAFILMVEYHVIFMTNTLRVSRDSCKPTQNQNEDGKENQHHNAYASLPSMTQGPQYTGKPVNADGFPLEATHTVHYLWCNKKTMLFSHYLGLLSVLRGLQPIKLVFHYTVLPQTDSYNSWFESLRDKSPTLELRHIDGKCGSKEMLKTMLDKVSHDGGGIYIADGLVLTHLPTTPPRGRHPVWFAFSDTPGDLTRGIVVVTRSLDEAAKNEVIQDITSSKPSCVDIASYDANPAENLCVKLGEAALTPLDFTTSQGAFAQLVRTWMYSTGQMMTVVNGTGEAIPRVSHYVRLRSNTGPFVKDFTFSQFLSVLSALYVAGFQQVFIHGNEEPSGEWWNQLKKENVTFVNLERPETVFQKKMTVPAHMSDVLRLTNKLSFLGLSFMVVSRNIGKPFALHHFSQALHRFTILQKYGGAYQDFDVVWTSHVPDWLLSYPAVVCPDWPRFWTWPLSFNVGVMLARRNAPYLDFLLDSYHDYRDYDWFFNAVLMPYKMKELHPDTVLVDRHLHVLCFYGKCHAPWHEHFVRDWRDFSPMKPVQLHEMRAIHVTGPKPAPSFTSPGALKGGRDIMAKAGRQILEKSGRLHLIQ